jgi:hypothetical protein
MSWSAADVAPGRYYFVVVVDPENSIGVYRDSRYGMDAAHFEERGEANESAVGGWSVIGRWFPSERSDGSNGSL